MSSDSMLPSGLVSVRRASFSVPCNNVLASIYLTGKWKTFEGRRGGL